jgi:hypothetical protein
MTLCNDFARKQKASDVVMPIVLKLMTFNMPQSIKNCLKCGFREAIHLDANHTQSQTKKDNEWGI